MAVWSIPPWQNLSGLLSGMCCALETAIPRWRHTHIIHTELFKTHMTASVCKRSQHPAVVASAASVCKPMINKMLACTQVVTGPAEVASVASVSRAMGSSAAGLLRLGGRLSAAHAAVHNAVKGTVHAPHVTHTAHAGAPPTVLPRAPAGGRRVSSCSSWSSAASAASAHTSSCVGGAKTGGGGMVSSGGGVRDGAGSVCSDGASAAGSSTRSTGIPAVSGSGRGGGTGPATDGSSTRSTGITAGSGSGREGGTGLATEARASARRHKLLSLAQGTALLVDPAAALAAQLRPLADRLPACSEVGGWDDKLH